MYVPRLFEDIQGNADEVEVQGSHASWKVLESSGIFPLFRAWKVMEIDIGSGKFWKFDVKVMESS